MENKQNGRTIEISRPNKQLLTNNFFFHENYKIFRIIVPTSNNSIHSSTMSKIEYFLQCLEFNVILFFSL